MSGLFMDLKEKDTRYTPSLYSLNPDLFAEADWQMWDWEARQTGIRPRTPQVIKPEVREEESD